MDLTAEEKASSLVRQSSQTRAGIVIGLQLVRDYLKFSNNMNDKLTELINIVSGISKHTSERPKEIKDVEPEPEPEPEPKPQPKLPKRPVRDPRRFRR